ncbi:GGDEF domain-containing protein [Rhodospirillum rubrum]|uniref:putative bifunctional diguanylate cyclase/phosphodiesterase n=1 Tax=Rhodospirillum rubrum TaxID=1085 RepID=UPI001EB0E47C|nr:GGDEF domain-containing phosphodiesterase [Rhodospirillum rubrum]MBK1664524.1 GGDEF domain-containing protein [Rhodospirillum rubrum]MBK1676221.1 GGDEF domain-containing protein [Rhodospirillum rubrum]
MTSPASSSSRAPSDKRERTPKRAKALMVWRAGPDGRPLDPTTLSRDPPAPRDGEGADAWLSLVHPEEREAVLLLWRRALREGEEFEARYRLHHGPSDYRWALGHGIPLRGDDGKVREWIGTVVDIHDHMEAERTIALNEERLRLALDSADLGVWECTIATNQWWFSEAALRILGCPPDAETSIETVMGAIHPDDLDGLRSRWHAARTGRARDRMEGEFRIQRGGGRLGWIACSARLVADDGKAVTRMLGTLRDITKTRLQREKLYHLAHFDPLTGLPNRHEMITRTQAILASGGAAGGAGAILLLDLDGFKEANDTLGQATGDALLKRIAHRLVSSLPADSLIGRVGGDEFLVVVPGVAEQWTATRIADGLYDVLTVPFVIGDRRIPLSGRIGIALAPRDGTSAQDLMTHAELALQETKTISGCVTRFFSPRLHDEARERQGMGLELRRATDNGEFELFYQPQIRLSDRAVVGAEALLRWRHPTRGVMPPAAFLHVLKRGPLAGEVGEWVVAKACADAAGLLNAGSRVRMAVNLFSAQFKAGTVDATVRRSLLESGLPAELLELEITEKVTLDRDEGILTCLKGLRDLGCGVAFDDYGTGYASLSMLKRYPLTRLKIDRAFVQHLAGSPKDGAIVRAVLSLGNTFGLSVTAEGIEEEEQEKLLLDQGCDEGQGYFFGRPMPLADFIQFLARVKKSPGEFPTPA